MYVFVSEWLNEYLSVYEWGKDDDNMIIESNRTALLLNDWLATGWVGEGVGMKLGIC